MSVLNTTQPPAPIQTPLISGPSLAPILDRIRALEIAAGIVPQDSPQDYGLFAVAWIMWCNAVSQILIPFSGGTLSPLFASIDVTNQINGTGQISVISSQSGLDIAQFVNNAATGFGVAAAGGTAGGSFQNNSGAGTEVLIFTTVALPGKVITFHMCTGSPAGVIAAQVGSIALNVAGGAGTTLFVKESGGSTTAGWVGK